MSRISWKIDPAVGLVGQDLARSTVTFRAQLYAQLYGPRSSRQNSRQGIVAWGFGERSGAALKIMWWVSGWNEMLPLRQDWMYPNVAKSKVPEPRDTEREALGVGVGVEEL